MSDSFGWSVAVSGDTVVVGACQEDSSTTGINSTPNEGITNAGAANFFSSSYTPTLTTPMSASVTAATATLGGNVTADGGAAITERGGVYSITTANADPLIGGSGVTKVTASGTTGVFTTSVTGLSTHTGYTYKAYATNAAGTSYTSTSTFTTLNTTPTNITLSASSIDENNAPNATLGTFTTTDPDAGDTFTCTSASGGADNASFTIDADALKLTPSADFETKNSYAITIRSTDQDGAFFEKDFTISITDVTLPQTITFGALSMKTYGDAPFTVSATGGASGQPVTFTASGPATISGTTVTITGWDVNLFFGGVGMMNEANFQPVRASGVDPFSAMQNLTLGQLISSASTFATGTGGSGDFGSEHMGFSAGQFQPTVDGYIGFRLNGTNYGWMRVSFTFDEPGALIRDWAYDDTGATILAGMVPEPGRRRVQAHHQTPDFRDLA